MHLGLLFYLNDKIRKNTYRAQIKRLVDNSIVIKYISIEYQIKCSVFKINYETLTTSLHLLDFNF